MVPMTKSRWRISVIWSERHWSMKRMTIKHIYRGVQRNVGYRWGKKIKSGARDEGLDSEYIQIVCCWCACPIEYHHPFFQRETTLRHKCNQCPCEVQKKKIANSHTLKLASRAICAWLFFLFFIQTVGEEKNWEMAMNEEQYWDFFFVMPPRAKPRAQS